MSRQRKGVGVARDYVSYLLRLWREMGEGTAQWRASLQDPHSSETAGFASLEELFGYLRRATCDAGQRNGNGVDREGESV